MGMPWSICLTKNRHIPRHLALSTNAIEKISSLSGMDNLKILSLGRNLIKKIENLDAVAETLEELWLSYNLISSLVRSSIISWDVINFESTAYM